MRSYFFSAATRRHIFLTLSAGNYASPTTSISEELRIQLDSANEMLLKYLRSCRKRRMIEGSKSRNASHPRQQEINSVSRYFIIL